jgi:hypothetical protein
VRRRVPDALYRLWFYVTVPGGRLETERVYTDVRPTDGTAVDSNRDGNPMFIKRLDSGRYSFDEFLTIEFDTRQRFDRDLIVTGKQTTSDADGSASDQRWIHTINGVAADGAEDRHDFAAAAAAADTRAESGPVHRLSDNVYVTSVVFDEPFAYSTSNWVKGQQTSLLTALNLYTEGF